MPRRYGDLKSAVLMCALTRAAVALRVRLVFFAVSCRASRVTPQLGRLNVRRATLAAGCLLAACGQSVQISTGMWTSEVTLSTGHTQLWSSKVERCIGPAAGDPVIGILSTTPLGPCTAVETPAQGANLSLIAQCLGRSGPLSGGMQPTRIRLSGSKTATTINASIEAELEMEPGRPKLTGKLAARRKGDC